MLSKSNAKTLLSPFLSTYAMLLLMALLVGVSIALSQQGQWVGIVGIGALIGIIFAGLIIHQPLFGVIAVIGFSFISVFLFHNEAQLGIPFKLSLLFKDGILIIVVMGWIYHLYKHKLTLTNSRLTLFVLAFISWVALRSVLSSRGIVIGLLAIRATLEFSILYFIVSSSIRTEKDIRFLLWGIILSSLLPVLFVSFQIEEVVNGLATTQVEEFGRIYFNRINILGSSESLIGRSNTANTFAAYLGTVLICLFTFLLFNKRTFDNKKLMIPLSAYSLMVTLLILLSFSRRVWVALLLVFIMLWALQRVSAHTLIMPLLFMMTIYLLLPDQIVEWIVRRFSTLAIITDENVSSTRLAEWRYLWGGISQSAGSLLFGQGVGIIGTLAKGIGSEDWVNGHNYYLTTFYQLGMIGLLFFGSILLEGCAKTLRVFKNSSDLSIRQGTLAAFGVIMLLSLSALAGNTFEAYPLNVIFWTFLGLTDASERLFFET